LRDALQLIAEECEGHSKDGLHVTAFLESAGVRIVATFEGRKANFFLIWGKVANIRLQIIPQVIYDVVRRVL
jgi:hypothetical protein